MGGGPALFPSENASEFIAFAKRRAAAINRAHLHRLPFGITTPSVFARAEKLSRCEPPSAIGRRASRRTIERRVQMDDVRIGEQVRTCLVVDDSSVVRKIARRILEDFNFQIIEAENGERALDACRRAMPTAVLLDWNMPVMDGHEFLLHLRRLPGGDLPKVVFCTTENNIDHISRALEAGADEYIMKPFDKDIIATKFHEVGLIAASIPV
jgi:two-component system, chemotaxis family, chemotaxis protein CheY